MNVTYIKTFLVVYESGNFTEAAKKLFIPQPTVSNRIRYLEEELNQDLFKKKGKGKRSVTLTEAGEKFLPYAKMIVEMLELASEALNNAEKNKVLKIGSTIPLTHPAINSQINSLLNNREGEKVHISFLDPSIINSVFMQNQLDMAFLTKPINNHIFRCEPLLEEDYDLVLSAKHRFATLENITDLRTIKDEVVLILDTDQLSNIENVIQSMCKYQIITNQIDLIKKVLLENGGVAILPSSYFNNEIGEGKLVRIPLAKEIGFHPIQYYIAYRNHQLGLKGMDMEGLSLMKM